MIIFNIAWVKLSRKGNKTII